MKIISSMTVFICVFSTVFAQSISPTIASISKHGGNGNDYPYCDAVIAVHRQEKSNNNAKKNLSIKGQAPRTSVDAWSSESGFVGKTPVLGLLVLDGRAASISRDMRELGGTKFAEPYVLSSTYAVIDDPKYQMDCWAKIEVVVRPEVPYEATMATVGVETKGQVEHLQVTPDQQFLTYDQDADSATWVKSADLDSHTMKFYNGSESGVCEVNYVNEYRVMDEAWWGIPNIGAPKLVWNFKTSTGVYYVGSKGYRVLARGAR